MFINEEKTFGRIDIEQLNEQKYYSRNILIRHFLNAAKIPVIDDFFYFLHDCEKNYISRGICNNLIVLVF